MTQIVKLCQIIIFGIFLSLRGFAPQLRSPLVVPPSGFAGRFDGTSGRRECQGHSAQHGAFGKSCLPNPLVSSKLYRLIIYILCIYIYHVVIGVAKTSESSESLIKRKNMTLVGRQTEEKSSWEPLLSTTPI